MLENQRNPEDVYRNLKEGFGETNLQFWNRWNTITVRHLNASKLHVNEKGTQVLSNEFDKATVCFKWPG